MKQLTSGDLTGYVYAANGPRLGKGNLTSFSCDVTKNGLLTANGLALTNAFVAGPQWERLEETDANFNMLHYNVFWEGKLLGTYTGTTYAQSNWHFALNDWVGTKRELTTSTGASWTSLSSGPFGDYASQTGSGSNPSEELFTSKVRDTESGLDDFLARHYSSNWGRFMSPDPSGLLYADPTNPQSLNLYGYGLNNPLTNVDPTGLSCVTGDDGTQGDDGDGKGCEAAGILPSDQSSKDPNGNPTQFDPNKTQNVNVNPPAQGTDLLYDSQVAADQQYLALRQPQAAPTAQAIFSQVGQQTGFIVKAGNCLPGTAVTGAASYVGLPGNPNISPGTILRAARSTAQSALSLGAGEQAGFAVGQAAKVLGPEVAEAAGELAASSIGKAVPLIAAAQGVYAAGKAQSYFASCYAQQ